MTLNATFIVAIPIKSTDIIREVSIHLSHYSRLTNRRAHICQYAWRHNRPSARINVSNREIRPVNFVVLLCGSLLSDKSHSMRTLPRDVRNNTLQVRISISSPGQSVVLVFVCVVLVYVDQQGIATW